MAITAEGWNPGGEIHAWSDGTGSPTVTKLLIGASSKNEWKLQSDKGQSVAFTLAASADGDQCNSWEFPTSELNGNGSTRQWGVVVADYDSLPAGVYKDTLTFTASLEKAPTDLSTISGEYTAKDGEVLTGTSKQVKISIADGATVTLKDVTIDGWNKEEYAWAGITCIGDATIVLKGTNKVNGFQENYPGIYVPVGSTLTIKGDGSLEASSNGYGAGIGGGYKISCGNITIAGGDIKATGSGGAAGIGNAAGSSTGYPRTCGIITIIGGKVVAKGGSSAPGIGAGDGEFTICGDIIITGGEITATGGSAGSGIGSGRQSTCGNIMIAGGNIKANGGTGGTGIGSGTAAKCGVISITGGKITATGDDGAAGIGSGSGEGAKSSCNSISITGGNIEATGGYGGAAIGTGYNGKCETITIANTVEKVTATKGYKATCSIGTGQNSICGIVTINDTVGEVATSPYEIIGTGSNSESGETGNTEPDEDSDVMTCTVELTLTIKASLTFNANEGSGEMSGVTMDPDSEYTLPECNFIAPEGMVFQEWSVKVGDADAVAMNPGDKVTLSADTIVTAIWAKTAIVTFKVVNGAWDDGTTDDKSVMLIGVPMKLAETDIPTVGSKPSEKFVAGSWDVEPDTVTEITDATTYTYTYAKETFNISGTINWTDDNLHNTGSDLSLSLKRISEKEGANEESVDVSPVWNGNTYTFSSLDVYDDEGYEYTYTVSVTALPDGYNSRQNIYDFIVYKTEHNHVYGAEQPAWQWECVDGEVSAKANLVCDICGEMRRITALINEYPNDTNTEITYIAAISVNNNEDIRQDSRTYPRPLTVNYNGEIIKKNYGEGLTLTADVLSDWKIDGVVRARGTKTFVFPVTKNVTVTSSESELTKQEAMINVLSCNGMENKFEYNVVWSLPDNAKMNSTMIYRCMDDAGVITTSKALLKAANRRSYNMDLKVRNGDFKYTATGLTSNSKQTVMAQIVYTINGTKYTLSTTPCSISIK